MMERMRIIGPFFIFLVSILGYSAYRTTATPYWLRPGAYAYYSVDAEAAAGPNLSCRHLYGFYGWECVETRRQEAILTVVFDCIAYARDGQIQISRTFDVDLDLKTGVVSFEGRNIGFWFFWVDTALSHRCNITLGDFRNETYHGMVCQSGMQIVTPYGNFSSEDLWGVLIHTRIEEGGLIEKGGLMFYEKKTGLLLAGSFIDPILQDVIGLEVMGGHTANNYELKDTNVFQMAIESEGGEGPGIERNVIYAAILIIPAVALIFIAKKRRLELEKSTSASLPQATPKTRHKRQ